MANRLELYICYDREMFPVRGVCTVCGDEMPQKEPRITNSPGTIRWLADQFKLHVAWKHPSKPEAVGEFEETFPRGLRPNVDIAGLNLRAEARALHAETRALHSDARPLQNDTLPSRGRI